VRSYGIPSAWYSITVTCDVSEACEMLAPLSYQGNAEKQKPPGKLSKKLETLPLEFDSSNII
jgi:hypothetical protein